MSTFRLALIQLAVGSNKAENLLNAFHKIKQAASAGAKMVALPECFNSPYGIQHFPAYAEKIPSGETATKLSEWAKEFGLYIIGGSIPESEEGNKLYNTCTVWNPKGELIALHRKIHLFDISIPGKITFEESKVLSPGKKFTTFDTEYCKVGVGICYDIRFAEMAQVYREKGCKLLVYPGAFNMTTGPAHWKILQQARALDNQVYVATCSPARDESAGYVAWGHSMVVDPWANVLVEASEKEEIVYMEIDLSKLEEIREQIPMTKQRRSDIYNVVVTTEEK